MDFCTLHQQLQILNEEDYNKLSENAISWINSFETEELKTFSIGLLNACMSTHYTANKIRIGPGFVISMQLVYELMRILPIFDPLFDSMLMSQTSSEAVNAIGLVITGFLEYILCPSWSAEEVARNINILKTVSLLTWKEAFTYQTQKQLANIISQALILQFQSSQNFLFFTHSVVGFETIIVTILRLTTLLLQNFIEPQSGLSECKKLPQPRKQILLEIAAIYDATWKSMGGENLNEWVREIDNPENFLSYAFTFLHKMCHLQDQICFTLFEPSVGDPGLQTRLLLAQDLYLTRACHMLLRVTQCRANLPTSWCKKLNDTDVYCFLRIATPHHLEAELLCCKKMPCEAKARRAGDGHVGLIAWALDHGSNVKEYAIAFLKAECLDDAEFATEILPRLLPHTRLLATDEQVTLVLIERITALRRKLIPYNHHKNLLQALMPLLSATTKTSLLSKLHTKPDTQVTPLSVEKARFASQLRNFVNHLTAGDSSTDTDDNTPSYPWISQQPILLSVEILIEANLLLLTRPMTFLLDIIRLPVTQNSAALLPVVHQLLDHLSFSFPLCLFGKDEPLVCSLFTNGLFQRDTDWNLEQTTLLDILQRFLPLNEQLDAVQVCIAAQASRFVKTTPNKTASSTQGVAVMPPNMPSQAGSTSNQLFSWSLSSLLHLSATWPILPKLISLFASHPCLPLLLTCLRPIFIPTPSLPPSVILPTCETLLDLIPTSSLSTKQHVVLLCLCGLDYDCVRQRLQDILMQDADLLTRIFDNLPLERFPDYRFNLKLPPGSLQSGYITPSCFNERFIDCLQLKSGISRVNEFVGQVFLQPITPTSLMTLFQFVSLTENLWVYAVRAILSSAELNPKIRCLWNAMPLHIMLVTLFTYLHQIMSTSRDEEEIVLRWALTLGCVDQLILAGLLNLSYRLRPKLTSISLMQNQGTLDFFDFIFSLLKMVFWTLFHAKSSTNPLLENGFILSIICLTMEALAQRLLVRIVLPSTNASKSHSTSSILTEQVGLLIAEVHSFKDRVKKTASGHLFDPLDHLCESLSIIEQSLQCQRHPLLTASLNCAVLESHL